jgi:hypothetical protein
VAYPNSIISIMCVIIDLILLLTPMPMPYYIFPSAFSEPKNQKRWRLVCVSPPPPLPTTAMLRCTASCALGRGPVCEGLAAGWRASQAARRTAFVPRACSHNWTQAPLCVPQGFNAGVLSPSAPASCCSFEFNTDSPVPLGNPITSRRRSAFWSSTASLLRSSVSSTQVQPAVQGTSCLRRSHEMRPTAIKLL